MTKIHEMLASSVAAEGVERAFVLMGDANLQLVADLAQAGVELVHARHENALVGMADGHARQTGRVGLGVVTCGPGLTQVASALTAAVRNRSPIVIFAGDTPQSEPYHYQEFDHGPFVASTGAVHHRLVVPGSVSEAAHRAFYTARSQRVPVVLTLPLDVQTADSPWESTYQPTDEVLPDPQRLHPDPDQVRRVAEQVAGRRSCAVVVGRGAVRAGAEPEISALVRRLDAHIGTTLLAKGALRGEHPGRYLGVVGTFGSTETREVLADADCVIGIGAGLGHYTTEAGYLFDPDALVVQVDTEPTGYHQGRHVADLYLRADATVGVAALDAELERLGVDRRGDALAATEAPPTVGSWGSGLWEDGRLDQAAVVGTLDGLIPTPANLVIGGGHFWTYVLTGLTQVDPKRFHVVADFGVIAQALSIGIGVTLADREVPTIIVEGDGGLIMHLQELETMARHDVPALLVVMNDGGYGAEKHQLDAQHRDGDMAMFGRVDCAGVAACLGVEAHRVDSLEDLTRQVERYVASPRPVLLDVQVSGTQIHPIYQRLYFGRSV